jgi:phage shock protein PspC (stress-responsive transcriptional regulator)
MKRISVTAKLNRSTLEFEEAAYERLEAYFADAARTLDGDPDQAEILGDLEQAVADQCTRRMRTGEKVVTLTELRPALEEIGNVQVPGSSTASESLSSNVARPLEQISQGAMVSGVCLGLARYFRLDVTLLRIIAVLLLLGTGGGMIVVYVGLMILLPYAPLEPGGPSVRWLPSKCREFVEFLRSKFSAVTN